jgi:ABC-type nitrate/sulfonate/bicarbonate transport system permease component
MNRSVLYWRTASFIVAAGFVGLWQIIANLRLVSPVFLPGPDRAWASLVRGYAIWPMLLATIHGFAAVEPRLYEVARSLHMSRPAVIFKIALPSASPDILSGMRLSLTVALILSVVCEILAGLDGLGHWVLLSARAFRSADLFAGVMLLGVIGYLTALAMSVVEKRLLKWRSSGH